MPIGFNSPARNFFLLGSTGEQLVTNFFKRIDQSTGTDGVYIPDEIRYNVPDQKFILAGTNQDSQSKNQGWFEKRDQGGTADWNVLVESTQIGVNTTLRALEIDGDDNLIVCGKTGTVPWIAKYDNDGNILWQSTSNTAHLEYTGISIDINDSYYVCGISIDNSNQYQAFVEKFNSSGEPQWGESALVLGGDVVLNKISHFNEAARVVSVGYLEDGNIRKGYVIKLDTLSQSILWDRTIEDFRLGQSNSYLQTECTDVYVDGNNQIYIIGTVFDTVAETSKGFIIKYTAEGNIIWQKETPANENIQFTNIKSDTETEQTIVFGTYTDSLNNNYGMLSKYSKDGTLIWRRLLYTSFDIYFGNVNLDADPSFYYLLFIDQQEDLLNNTPDSYVFGKVSTSGNGLGNFEYSDGLGTVFYETSTIQDTIGRLSDGSVRQDTSDLITYPFNANKILFDDLATQISNKKIQISTPEIFKYSGGGNIIRPVDFEELELIGDGFTDGTYWLDYSGNDNHSVVNGATFNYSTGYWDFDGINDYIIGNTSSNLDLSQPCSIDIWVYFDSFIPENPRIIEIQDSITSIQIIRDGVTTRIGTKNSSFQAGTDGTAWFVPVVNTWYNILVVWEPSTSSTTLYLDSNLQTSFGSAAIGTGNQPNKYVLGVRSDFQSTTWLDGRIGEVRIYPRALTPAQVFQNYNATREKYTGVPASTDPGLTSLRFPAPPIPDEYIVAKFNLNSYQTQVDDPIIDSGPNSYKMVLAGATQPYIISNVNPPLNNGNNYITKNTTNENSGLAISFDTTEYSKTVHDNIFTSGTDWSFSWWGKYTHSGGVSLATTVYGQAGGVGMGIDVSAFSSTNYRIAIQTAVPDGSTGLSIAMDISNLYTNNTWAYFVVGWKAVSSTSGYPYVWVNGNKPSTGLGSGNQLYTFGSNMDFYRTGVVGRSSILFHNFSQQQLVFFTDDLVIYNDIDIWINRPQQYLVPTESLP